IVVIAFGLAVARAVSRPLNEAVSVAERVAQGDLTVDIRSDSKDETGMLMHSLRAMNDSLNKIVSEVRYGTDAITTASQE
ncbi:HAMP domain-containing protein, partial [Acinetobacter baumannii]